MKGIVGKQYKITSYNMEGGVFVITAPDNIVTLLGIDHDGDWWISDCAYMGLLDDNNGWCIGKPNEHFEGELVENDA